MHRIIVRERVWIRLLSALMLHERGSEVTEKWLPHIISHGLRYKKRLTDL